MVKELISVRESQLFESAIVNVVIMMFSRGSTDGSVDDYLGCRAALQKPNVWDHVSTHGYACEQGTLDRDVWSLCTPEENLILEKLEKAGKSPTDLGFKIRLGIATGSNKAFVVSKESRDAFVCANKGNDRLLKPVIRGRDVDRFVVPTPSQYLILSKNGVNLPKESRELTKHLEGFGDDFKNRGAQGQNWWNLRACSFYDDFEKDRVVWIELTNKPRFAVCRKGVYLLNTAYFLLPTSDFSADFLVGYFNSKACEFYVANVAQTSGMGTTRWFKEYVERIPIPKATDAERAKVAELSRSAAAAVKSGKQSSVTALEDEINQIIYRLFNLASDEIKLIESALES